jgi:preprotein translocase subunit YajC
MYLLQTAPPAAMGGIQLGLLVVMVVVLYFFMLRPQQKRQKETRKMLENMKKGDKVITIGGLCGQIDEIKEKTVFIRTDAQNGTRLEFLKSAISEVKIDVKAKETANK